MSSSKKLNESIRNIFLKCCCCCFTVFKDSEIDIKKISPININKTDIKTPRKAKTKKHKKKEITESKCIDNEGFVIV